MGWGTGRYPATRTTRITACALARAIRMTMMTTGIWSSRTRNTPGQGASVWGGANQLAANATSTVSASYSYDPFGRRVKAATAASVRWYLWDREVAIGQYFATGSRGELSAPSERRQSRFASEARSASRRSYWFTPTDSIHQGCYQVLRGRRRGERSIKPVPLTARRIAR